MTRAFRKTAAVALSVGLLTPAAHAGVFVYPEGAKHGAAIQG